MTTIATPPDQITCPDWCVVGVDQHRRDYRSAGVIHHESTATSIPTVDHDPVIVASLISQVDDDDPHPELHVRLTDKLLNPVQTRALIAALQRSLAYVEGPDGDDYWSEAEAAAWVQGVHAGQCYQAGELVKPAVLRAEVAL